MPTSLCREISSDVLLSSYTLDTHSPSTARSIRSKLVSSQCNFNQTFLSFLMSPDLCCPRKVATSHRQLLKIIFKTHFLGCTSNISSAPIVDNEDHFHHWKIFYWTALLYNPFPPRETAKLISPCFLVNESSGMITEIHFHTFLKITVYLDVLIYCSQLEKT